jgi:hypothetical protein
LDLLKRKSGKEKHQSGGAGKMAKKNTNKLLFVTVGLSPQGRPTTSLTIAQLIFLDLPHKSLASREHKDITSNRCKSCTTPKEKSGDWTHVFTEEKHMIMCMKKLLNPTHNRSTSMLIFCPSSPTRKLSN